MSSFDPGHVIIEAIELHTHTGQLIRLEAAFIDLQIYEDMFSPTIFGSLSLHDSFDLINNAPVVGGEKIVLKLQSSALPKTEDKIYWQGLVYKLTSNVDVGSSSSSVYLLHFTSPETFVNETKKISKHLFGSVLGNVQTLYRDPAYLGTQRAVSIEEPAISLSLTTPYWSPFKIIDWFAKNSLRAEAKTPDYVHFETLNRGFQFGSIGTIIAESKPVAELYYTNRTHMTIPPSDMTMAYAVIDRLYMDNVFDIISRAQRGMYGSKLLMANTVSKNIQIVGYDLDQEFERRSTLNEHKAQPSNLFFTKNAHVTSIINQEFSFDNQRSYKFEDWVLQRNASLQVLENTFKVDIDIAGRFDIGVGRKVTIFIQQSRPADTSEPFSEYQSGDYLITACCHRISNSGFHTITAQCVTDSLSKALP